MTKSVAQLLSAGHLLLLPPLLLAAAAARNYCLCAGRSTWRPVSAARDSHCWRRSSPSVGAAPLPGAHASRRSASTTSSEARGAPPPPPASKAPSLGGTNEPDEQTSARLSRSPLLASPHLSATEIGLWPRAEVSPRGAFISANWPVLAEGRARTERAASRPTGRPTDRPSERQTTISAPMIDLVSCSLSPPPCFLFRAPCLAALCVAWRSPGGRLAGRPTRRAT